MGLLSGVLDLAKAVIADPEASKHHVSGVARLSRKGRKFVVMAAMSAYPSDTLLTELLEDDRVVKRLPHLEQCLEDEMHWVSDLAEPVWELLNLAAGGDGADMGECSSRELRSDTLAAAHASVAFASLRVFKPAKQHPWSLAQGDIDQNLETLQQLQEAPAEPTTQKIWRLVRIGFSRATLVKGIELFREIGWSSTSVEQQHGSASTVHRYHKTYGTETLVSRSMIHCLRQFFSPSADRAAAADLMKQIQLAEAMNPARFTARQMYFKELSDTAAKARQSGTVPSHVEGVSLQTFIMKKHSARFAALPEQVKAAFEQKAAFQREESRRQIAQDVEHIQARLGLHLRRLASEQEEGAPPMVLSTCKFSDTDIKVIDAFWRGRQLTERKVKALRKAAIESPLPPGAAEKAKLGAHTLCVERTSAAKPPWLPTLCNNRESFRDIALVIRTGEGSRAFLFLYAKQSPYMAVFAPLAESEIPFRPLPVDSSSWGPLFLNNWDLTFNTVYDVCLEAHELGWADGAFVDVISGLVRLGSTAVGADGPLHSFEYFVKGFPASQQRQPYTARQSLSAGSASSSSANVNPELLVQHPWLARHSNPSAEGAKANPEASSESEPDDETEAEGAALAAAEAEVEGLFEELYRKREEWFQTARPRGSDFTFTILGCPWSFAQSGKATDSCIARASTADSKSWRTRYGMNQTARFSIALYGETGAAVMSQTWADKLQYYYDLFVASAEPNFCVHDRASLRLG